MCDRYVRKFEGFGGENMWPVGIFVYLSQWLTERRSSRTSSPRSGCALGLPFFALRTWSVGNRQSITCDHRRN